MPDTKNNHPAKKHRTSFDASGFESNLGSMLSLVGSYSPSSPIQNMGSVQEEKHKLKSPLVALGSSSSSTPLFPVNYEKNSDSMVSTQLELWAQCSFQKNSQPGVTYNKEDPSKRSWTKLVLGSEHMGSSHTGIPRNQGGWLYSGQSDSLNESGHHPAHPSQLETSIRNIHTQILPQIFSRGIYGANSSPSGFKHLSGAFDSTGFVLSQISMEKSEEGGQALYGSRKRGQGELGGSSGEFKISQPLPKSQITRSQNRAVGVPCARAMNDEFSKHNFFYKIFAVIGYRKRIIEYS